MEIKLLPVADILPYARNPRDNTQAVADVAASIREFGFRQPIVVDDNMTIIVGHTHWQAAQKLGLKEVPVHIASGMTEQQVKAYRLADNRVAENAEWDADLLKLELEDLDGAFTGFTDDEVAQLLSDEAEDALDPPKQKLSETFGAPPFTVLDARQKYWMDRKAEWRNVGLWGTEGREENLTWDIEGSAKKFFNDNGGKTEGTSIFDPVLTEILYRWFSRNGCETLDPFAGGVTRGAVGALLGRNYTGVDLSQTQVDTNKELWTKLDNSVEMEGTASGTAQWIRGDSSTLNDHLPKDKKYDFILTCPPYGDLEQYTDDPKDMSNMLHADFLKVYEAALTQAVERLEEDRFAAVVVGDFRDKKGNYRNFVSDTINIMIKAGAKLYNEAILYTPAGNLSLRAERPFRASRKLAKTHQNVLIFAKGDGAKAADWALTEMSVKQGQMIKDHAQILVFLKGDAKKATQYLGDPENFTTLEQDVDVDEEV